MPLSDNVELRSEEFQEIIGRMPHWIVRSGITIVFVFIVLFFIILSYIQYPEKVEGRASITTTNLPVSVMSQANGRIKVLVKENAQVDHGAHLALIENSANMGDVMRLDSMLKEKNEDLFLKPFKLLSYIDYNMQLGDIQAPYLQLTNYIERYHNFVLMGSTSAKLSSIRKELSFLKSANERLTNQLKLTLISNKIVEKRYLKDSLLARSKLISLNEYETSKGIYLESLKNIDNIHLNILNNHAQIMHQDSEIIQMGKSDFIDKQDMEQRITGSMHQLISDIDLWKKRYLLISPYKGYVSYSSLLSDEQFITLNQQVFKVTPIDSSLLVNTFIPVSKSGKIRSGMQALITLDNYPYQEFGMLIGTVKTISLIPINGEYNVKILLKNGLNTTHGKNVDFRQEMEGTVNIVTKDLSVLERIIFKVREMLTI